jgi:DNA-binding LacI/PurR family transcriptional regulator
VINQSGYVVADARERGLAVMRTLNYRPNSAAQARVTGRTRMLGVIASTRPRSGLPLSSWRWRAAPTRGGTP